MKHCKNTAIAITDEVDIVHIGAQAFLDSPYQLSGNAGYALMHGVLASLKRAGFRVVRDD